MPDHGIDKTEQAVLTAFNDLVLREPYDHIRVADLVRESDVGRSTFYDHFRDKDDVLIQSMAGIFGVLASVLRDECNLSHVERILDHFSENQQKTRQLLNSPSIAVVRHGLAQTMQSLLPEKLPLPAAVVAQQLAEAAISLIRSWLTTNREVEAPVLARALQSSLRGIVDGYVRNRAMSPPSDTLE